jgi:hypothetical protein
MVMIEVITPFDFYHDGVTRSSYASGMQDIPEDAATVALAEGWAVEVKKSGNKSKKVSESK